jgi:hypothetical protein
MGAPLAAERSTESRRKWPPRLVVVTSILLELVLLLWGFTLLERLTFASDLDVCVLHFSNGTATIYYQDLPGRRVETWTFSRSYRLFPFGFYVTPSSDNLSRRRFEVTFQLWFLALIFAIPPTRYMWRHHHWRRNRTRHGFEVIVGESAAKTAREMKL